MIKWKIIFSFLREKILLLYKKERKDMRKAVILSAFLFALNVSAQTPVLIDTLNETQKKILADEYTKRKEDFLSHLNVQASSKETKRVKSIFGDAYDDIIKSIGKNELFSSSPLNQYLNSILADIKKKNPAIPEINILVSREFEANAYNVGEGTIILNQYLLSDLDNEDELAYAICHEIAHQYRNHVLNSILSFAKKDNSNEMKTKVRELKRQRYNNRTEAENLLKDIAYKNSKENRKKEMEADSLGYVFYSQLGRSKQQPVKTLVHLKDSDYEGDSLTLKDYKKLFSAPELHFNAKWFSMDDYGAYHYKESTKFNTDSLRTHPNMDERIEHLKKAFPQFLNKPKSDEAATVSQEFNKWHNNAMYQNVYNEYAAKHYGNSLYEALKLYNRKPTPFLKKMIGQNFEKLYEAQKKYRLNRYVSQVNVHRYTDSFNLFCTFINNLRLDDFKAFSDYFSKENSR